MPVDPLLHASGPEAVDPPRSWAERLGPRFDPAAVQRLEQLDPGGESGLIEQLLELYRQTLGTQVEAMQRALQQHDADLIRQTAHSSRSSSLSMGLHAFADECLLLERLAAGRSDEAFNRAGSWVQQARVLIGVVEGLLGSPGAAGRTGGAG